MDLIETVTRICRRLAPLGWSRLLSRHGLKLDSHTLGSSQRLAAELMRPIPIDRTVAGFEDFWPDGCRAIQPGRPSRSLLYHAFASPLVHPLSDGISSPNAYPTLFEIDAIENYIYSRSENLLPISCRPANHKPDLWSLSSSGKASFTAIIKKVRCFESGHEAQTGSAAKAHAHSDIRTTMNIYGAAYDESKRQANERVAGKLLAQIDPPAPKPTIQ